MELLRLTVYGGSYVFNCTEPYRGSAGSLNLVYESISIKIIWKYTGSDH